MDDAEMRVMAEACWHFDVPWPEDERQERLMRRSFFFTTRMLNVRMRELGEAIVGLVRR